MGTLDNDYAVPYCIERIKDGKTETRQILDRYFSKLTDKDEITETLASLLENDEIIYDFQKFAVIRWLFQTEVQTDAVVSTVREELRQGFSLKETENYAMAYLGNHGNEADWEYIKERYTGSRDRVQKSVMLMSIRHMEESMRRSCRIW